MSKGLMILPIGAGVIGQDDVPLVRIMDSDETPTTITVYGVVDTVQPVTAVTWTVNGVEQSGDVSRSPVLELTNLQPETSYYITLRATNINGESSASARTITTKKITSVTPNDVLDGVSYYNLDVYYEGTIPIKDENDIVVNGRDVTVPTGYYPESETVSVSSEYIIPTGTKNISGNGTEDVTQYAEVNVNVQPPLYSPSNVDPTTSQQTIDVPTGYYGLGPVTVNGVTGGIDPNIQAGNIKKDVTILGVTGTFDPTPTLTPINVIPTKESQVISPTGGVDGFNEVNVYPVTALIDRNITPENIKKDVAILGVTGTFEGGIQPTGTYNIIANGTYDITNYANVNVQVPQGDYNFLCFTANEANCTVGMQHLGTNASTTKPTLYYSTDKQTWNTWDGTNITLANQNDKVYFFGNNLDGFSFSSSNFSRFTSTGDLSISGNLMTLITMYGDREYLPNNYCFYSLFNGTTITDASNLLLPATTITNGCYKQMFYGCINLISSPISLQATEVPDEAYYGMFNGCNSLVNIMSSLPATTSGNSSYEYMFQNCTSLTTAPEIFANTIGDRCFASMFEYCAALVTPPSILPAQILRKTCYYHMFYHCSSLTTAPELPILQVAVNSCYEMFTGANLTTAPIITATPSASQCYSQLLRRNNLNNVIVTCNSWSSGNSPRWLMENEATGIVYKPLNNTSIPLNNDGGVPTGWTAVDIPYITDKNETIEFTIPTGWSVYYTTDGTTPTTSSSLYTQPIDCSQVGDTFTLKYIFTDGNVTLPVFSYNYTNMFYVEALTNNTVLNTKNIKVPTYGGTTKVEYSTDKKLWSDVHYTMSTYTLTNTGDRVYFRKKTVDGDTWGQGNIQTNSGTIKAGGSLEYAVYHENTGNRPNSGGCGNMFQGCTGLVDASDLKLFGSNYLSMFSGCSNLVTAPSVLPATTLIDYAYQSMFNGCTSLTTAPVLPAATLSTACYQGMFTGCTSLVNAPALPATTLTDVCYNGMFSGCTSLNSVTCLATNISAHNCTGNWLLNVSSTGTFTKDSSMSDWTTGVDGIPANWTVVDAQ